MHLASRPLMLSVSLASFLLLNAKTTHAQKVLILTDASGGALNGGTHVSDLIAAFTG